MGSETTTPSISPRGEIRFFHTIKTPIFDARGELMAMFFGARKPGVPEREEWRRIVRSLAPLEGVAA